MKPGQIKPLWSYESAHNMLWCTSNYGSELHFHAVIAKALSSGAFADYTEEPREWWDAEDVYLMKVLQVAIDDFNASPEELEAIGETAADNDWFEFRNMIARAQIEGDSAQIMIALTPHRPANDEPETEPKWIADWATPERGGLESRLSRKLIDFSKIVHMIDSRYAS